MRRTFWSVVFIIIFIAAFATKPLLAAQKKDNCASEGIVVKNLTMLDLWYKKKGGNCSIWIHDHVIVVRPEDAIELFSDMTCRTLYCESNPTYKDYRTVDINGNCKVRILPDCTLSDI